MRLTSLVATLVLPLLAAAQSSTVASASQGNSVSASQASQTQSGSQSGSVSASPTPSPIVSQITTVIVGLSSGRTPVTITSVFNTTITPSPTQQTSAQANGTTSASSSSSTGPLPTAPADINGGGQDLPGGAPYPGAKPGDPKYGPNDDHISAALALTMNTFLAVVGGATAALVLL